jgi:TolB-like protein
MILAFSNVEIDPAKGEVRRDGKPVAVAPRVFSLLHLLAANAERMVTRDEIVDKVWDGRVISESAISTSVKEARQAIGDSGARQDLIRTLHGQGFRCIADVRILATAPNVAASQAEAPNPIASQGLIAGKPSIAVLPFANVAAAGEPDPLGDGLAAELISALSRLRFLSVTARGSSFRFRQSDPDFGDIAALLGVRYCLSGIIEAGGSDIAVTVELASTVDGNVIWSDRFSGAVQQVHEIRRRIVAEVIGALELHVPRNEAQAARLLNASELDAWGQFHLGLQHLYRFNSADNGIAETCFNNAIARDPDLARAHAGLSFVAFQSAFMGYAADTARYQDAALAHAEKSLALDALDPFVNHCMGRARWITGDLAEAETWIGRSLDISPNFAQGHYLRALLNLLMGQSIEVREGNQLAMALSPLDPLLYAMLGTQALSYLHSEEFDQAATWAERGATAPGSHYLLGMIVAAARQLQGNPERARHWVELTRSRRPDATIERFFEAFPFQPGANRTRMEKALDAAGF